MEFGDTLRNSGSPVREDEVIPIFLGHGEASRGQVRRPPGVRYYVGAQFKTREGKGDVTNIDRS